MALPLPSDFSFIRGLRNAQENAKQVVRNQNAVTNRSGGNIQFDNSRAEAAPQVSENYAKTLKDAIKFYQKEFNITPRATIDNDIEELAIIGANGAAFPDTDKTGQHRVTVDAIRKGDEDIDRKANTRSASRGWHPANSGDIGTTNVHELGHILTYQLFQDTAEDSNSSKKQAKTGAPQLVSDALNDITKDDDTRRMNATLEVSEYATTNPYETISEALTDYYYNKNDAADLSKAIVKRLKSKGSMYGINQTGGINLGKGSDNFLKNLRRYNAIQ